MADRAWVVQCEGRGFGGCGGCIRMFDTYDEAKVCGDALTMPVAVTKSAHYRGKIGVLGVAFGDSDQSFSQLLAAINHAY